VESDGSRNQAIRQELEHVLSSAGFTRNDRQSQFLRFLVERHLEGKDNELKESVIGVEVFGREPGYDPKLDAIVRTEAVRLRARLDKYYATEGSANPLIIELPKGGYKPVFRARPILPREGKTRSTRRWWVAAALAAAIAGASGVVWWSARTSDGPFTVAVLPLENLDRDPASDYFADGLTDEIIRNLSVIDGLTVPSRTSSFALKGKSLNPAEAGKQLGADYLVEGSVQHAGDQLRVNVALIRVRDDFRVWSERFDRKLTDVFAIQDEISLGIANTLRLRFPSGRRR
jgi:adenylate cyclase